MKKASLFVAAVLTVTWSATSLTPPVAAQFDPSYAVAASQGNITRATMDGYAARSRARNRRTRRVRNTRYHRRSRSSSTGRQTRTNGRTLRRTNSRLRR